MLVRTAVLVHPPDCSSTTTSLARSCSSWQASGLLLTPCCPAALLLDAAATRAAAGASEVHLRTKYLQTQTFERVSARCMAYANAQVEPFATQLLCRATHSPRVSQMRSSGLPRPVASPRACIVAALPSYGPFGMLMSATLSRLDSSAD
jgi:hypothetical protein